MGKGTESPRTRSPEKKKKEGEGIINRCAGKSAELI